MDTFELVDSLPTEATAEDVGRAQKVLGDDEPVDAIVLAELLGVSERTVWRWKKRGCSGPEAILVHYIIRSSNGVALSPPP